MRGPVYQGLGHTQNTETLQPDRSEYGPDCDSRRGLQCHLVLSSRSAEGPRWLGISGLLPVNDRPGFHRGAGTPLLLLSGGHSEIPHRPHSPLLLLLGPHRVRGCRLRLLLQFHLRPSASTTRAAPSQRPTFHEPWPPGERFPPSGGPRPHSTDPSCCLPILHRGSPPLPPPCGLAGQCLPCTTVAMHRVGHLTAGARAAKSETEYGPPTLRRLVPSRHGPQGAIGSYYHHLRPSAWTSWTPRVALSVPDGWSMQLPNTFPRT